MSSRQIALSGIFSALAVVFLMLGGVIPGATFCAPVLAMAALLPVLEECGPRAAGTAWLAGAVLALILDPDREAAMVYLCFGWYPLLRPHIARLPSRLMRLAAKLAVCSGTGALLYGFLLRLMGLTEALESASGWLAAVTLITANITFLLVDLALGRLTLLWRHRLRRRFFGGRGQ